MHWKFDCPSHGICVMHSLEIVFKTLKELQ